MLFPSLVHQIIHFGLGNHSPHGLDKGSLSFAGLLFQVIVEKVRRSTVGSENNDLRRFHGVYMGSKQHHKIDVISKVCSSVE
ncbi:hypothetical protein TNCV_339931 [Trichonephila clavipes]|nr:hypothetical protein TNCV_339931 [Trichonephila clavipes]